MPRPINHIAIITFERSFPPLVDSIDRSMVIVLRSIDTADSQALHAGPVDTAGDSHQITSSDTPDNPLKFSVNQETLDELELLSPALGRYLC